MIRNQILNLVSFVLLFMTNVTVQSLSSNKVRHSSLLTQLMWEEKEKWTYFRFYSVFSWVFPHIYSSFLFLGQYWHFWFDRRVSGAQRREQGWSSECWPGEGLLLSIYFLPSLTLPHLQRCPRLFQSESADVGRPLWQVWRRMKLRLVLSSAVWFYGSSNAPAVQLTLSHWAVHFIPVRSELPSGRCGCVADTRVFFPPPYWFTCGL